MSICQSWICQFDRQIRKNLGLPQFTRSHQDFDESDDFDPLAIVIPSGVAPIDPDTRLVDRYADFLVQ